jgi:hypothetical protein
VGHHDADRGLVTYHRHTQDASESGGSRRFQLGVIPNVRNVNGAAGENRPAGRALPGDRHRKQSPQEIAVLAVDIVDGIEVKPGAVVHVDGPGLSLTQSSGALRDRVEHGLDIGRRAADDTQDLARRRLLLKRLRQVAITGLQLLEQPHILDGDDGLVGEGLEQGDLAVREEPGLDAPEADRANRDTFAHQRDAELRPCAMLPRELAPPGKLVRLALQVSDVESAPIQHRAAVERLANEGDCEGPGGNWAVMSNEQKPIAVPPEDLGVGRLA